MDYNVLSRLYYYYKNQQSLEHGACYPEDCYQKYSSYPSPVSDPDKSKTIESSDDKELYDILARLRIEFNVQSMLSALIGDAIGGDDSYKPQAVSTTEKLGTIYNVPDEFKDLTIASMPIESLQKLYQRLSLERDIHSIINSLRYGSGENVAEMSTSERKPISPSTPIEDLYHSALSSKDNKSDILKVVNSIINKRGQ
jgi:hypothetical protein